MNFLNWLTLIESSVGEDPLPDLNQVGYFGCVLHKWSQNDLITAAHKFMMESKGTSPSVGWSGKAHHMTVKFKPQIADLETMQHFMGQQIRLTVENWVYDNHCLTVVVKPEIDLPVVGIPHITVAHSHEVSSAYSNTLLLERSRWQPVHEELVLYSYLMAVEHGNVPVWPRVVVPLAAPSISI